MIGLGIARIATGQGPVSAAASRCSSSRSARRPLGIILVLRAFAAGSVALTGVEAIANGVPAFKPPEAKNAANTMLTMAILLGVLFIGITFVADGFGIRPTEPGRADGRRHGRRRGLRRRDDPVSPLPGRDGADPLPGRQHELQRLPPARRDPGPGRVHAAPVRVPRRPPRLLLGDRRPRHGRRGDPRRSSAATPTRSSRSTRWASSSASRSPRRGWFATGSPSGSPAGGGGRASTPSAGSSRSSCWRSSRASSSSMARGWSSS